jgi:hypothetical protein
LLVLTLLCPRRSYLAEGMLKQFPRHDGHRAFVLSRKLLDLGSHGGAHPNIKPAV